MIDIFGEVMASMGENRSRVLLTGFSVGWGIFLLIVMLGSGGGIINGVTNGFTGEDENVMTINPGRTMFAAGGRQKNAKICFYPEDCERLKRRFADVISRAMPQMDTIVRINYAKDHVDVPMLGYETGYLGLKNRYISAGRDLNAADIGEGRKVCVVSAPLARRLFGNAAVGKRIRVYNNSFLIIGVATSRRSNDQEMCLYAPISTVSSLFFQDNRLASIIITLNGLDTPEANESFKRQVRTFFAEIKGFSPKDEKAVRVSSDYEYLLQIRGVLGTLRLFVWIIGLATLCIGVVGVSNIMLISVRERMKELGVRRAVGAGSGEIVRLVLLEAVVITVIFGYIGMLVGIGLTQLLKQITDAQLGANNTVFCNPTVDITVVLIANAIMVVCGLIAGYIPARKATTVKLVDALAGIS